MTKDTRPIEVGDRFETRDKRHAGRVVEVTEVHPDTRHVDREERAQRLAHVWGMKLSDVVTWLHLREVRFHIRTEAHPRNPSAVGNVSRVTLNTLRTRYRRISR